MDTPALNEDEEIGESDLRVDSPPFFPEALPAEYYVFFPEDAIENDWYIFIDAFPRCPTCNGKGCGEDLRPCPECGGRG